MDEWEDTRHSENLYLDEIVEDEAKPSVSPPKRGWNRLSKMFGKKKVKASKANVVPRKSILRRCRAMLK